jgi:hypothetical protein
MLAVQQLPSTSAQNLAVLAPSAAAGWEEIRGLMEKSIRTRMDES